MSNSYYIDASRSRSISNNDVNNNSWTYKLNDGIELPAGTQVQVTNSFINKQGITSNSIEIVDDKVEILSVGFTVPQNMMWLTKPERTAKDDRLTTAVLEDPEGSLGLQTAEISTVLTNYFDGMVQHNIVHSGGIPLFTKSFTVETMGQSGAVQSKIEVEGDQTAFIKVGMPCVVRNLVASVSQGVLYDDLRESIVNGTYLYVSAVAYGDPLTEFILTSGSFEIGPLDYANDKINIAKVYFPDVDSSQYDSCVGVAMINSLVGTKEDGTTLYDQTKLGGSNFASENPPPVPILEDQQGTTNYQAGIESSILTEEFRKETANLSRDNVFNASQTLQDSYQFDRGSYSFYFGPAVSEYDSVNSVVKWGSASLTSHFPSTNSNGLNGHTIRQNCNGLTIAKTDSVNRDYYDYIGATNEVPFYPFLMAQPHTEYTNREDLSIPKPSQPAVYKDAFSPQVDYLNNGFSWDSASSRVEIFTASEIEMINYEGNQNPLFPNAYQLRENQAITENSLKTLPTISFLDRIILSQTMIGGMANRQDSHPYVTRLIDLTVNNVLSNNELIRRNMIFRGVLQNSDQTTDVQNSLFPAIGKRGDLDSSFLSTDNEFSTSEIFIYIIITGVSNEGQNNAQITGLRILSNLRLTGAVITDFTSVVGFGPQPYDGTDAGSQISFANFEPYDGILLDDSQLKITVTSEEFVNHSPQKIPIFSAKGSFSELKGNTQNQPISTINDIELGGGQNCKFNYFMDSMHNQTEIDYLKMVGENYAINPNVVQNISGFILENLFRVASHPYFNHGATSSGLRESKSSEKRIYVTQRANSRFGGIHPNRNFETPDDSEGLTNFTNDMKNIQSANYLFGSTSRCSLGAMRPPGDKAFDEAAAVSSIPIVADVPTPANNGLTSLAADLELFDPDLKANVLKVKITDQKLPSNVMAAIQPMRSVDDAHPAVTQDNLFGEKENKVKLNCASALGSYEAYPYSTPMPDMSDTGGSGDDLCIVQLQSLVDYLDANYSDYVLRPLTSDIEINIPKGVYSINGFIDLFNSQIIDIDKNDSEEMASINNFKTIRRFNPLNGNSLSGGQVTLLNDFLPETHARTIYSEDEDSEFVKNPLCIAVTVQVYNDLVTAWQYCGTADLVSYYMAAGDEFENCYYSTSEEKTIGGGSYTWKNFRDKYYWCEFVDKYSDNITELITATETDNVTNYDTQFYFENGYVYGKETSLGNGPNSSLVPKSQSIVGTQTIPQINNVRKYNSVKRGIYVGSPEFELTFDSDQSLFSFDGLHYSFKNPTVDLVGESAFPADAVGKPSVLYRTTSDLIQGNYTVNGVDANLDSHIKNAIEKPIDKISGCFIFNMAKSTSSRLGNFINSDSSNVGRIFNDYFNSNKEAKNAWNTTLWSRLGFEYETFNTQQNNNIASYYLNPVTDQNNMDTNFVTSQKSYLIEQAALTSVSTKLRPRQMLCSTEDLADFNEVSSTIDNNYLPGITTSSIFDIRAIPTISSSPGVNEGAQNELVRLYNNASISTINSMSGGHVYFPMKLANHGECDPVTNYTYQNTSINSEGYIDSSGPQGNTYITSKSGAAIPEASQLLYQRNYQFQATKVVGYSPDSFYQKTFTQPVVGQTFPTAYEFENYQYGITSPFEFSNKSQFNISNGVFRDRNFNLNGSMFLATQTTPIVSSSNQITAGNLPTLTEEGHYIITSDIIKTKDSINGSDQIPILGIVPISSLSSQDFITSFNDITHSIDQTIVINSIKIEILNPDLTPPLLQPNSTVIIRIIFPKLTGLPPQVSDPTKLKKKEIKEKLVGI